MRVAEEACVRPAASGTSPNAPGVGLRSAAGAVCEGNAFSECDVPGEVPETATEAVALPAHFLSPSLILLIWTTI